jgi:opacity protein-like surface antigen
MRANSWAPTGLKEQPMRRVSLWVILFLGLSSPAFAEDFPYPPVVPIAPAPPAAATVGPATFTRWSGFYFGGQFGYSNGSANFGNSTNALIAYALRETALEADFSPSSWPILGTANNSAATYGGFVGYNTQWQDLVLGIEVNLNRSGLSLNAPSTPIGPLTTAADSLGDTHTVTMSASGSVTNLDFGTGRLRAGYVLGSFMPYGFAGVAVGISNISLAANIHDVQCTTATPPSCGAFNFSSTNTKSNEVLYGFTAGAGVDVAVTPNVFLRAELEWDQFNPPPGILLTIATARVGAGLKF